jgi:glutathione S-transferase
MITVFGFDNVPAPVRGVTRDLRVLWALEESGLPYRLYALDFAAGELKGAEYLGVNPFGAVPAIDDAGFRLFESAAIVLYVAEKSGRLLPADAHGRTRTTQWAFAAVNTVEPACVELFVIDTFLEGQDWAERRRPTTVESARHRLATLERELADRPYLLGDEFTVADILMTRVLRIVAHTDLLAAVPHVDAYRTRCEARPAWRKVLADYDRRLAA